MQCPGSVGMWRGRGPVTWVRGARDSTARRAPGGAARTVVTHLVTTTQSQRTRHKGNIFCDCLIFSLLSDVCTQLVCFCEQLLKEFQETRENSNPLIKSVIRGLKSCKKYLINRGNKKQMNVLMEETSVSVIRRPSRQLGEHCTHSSHHCVPLLSHFCHFCVNFTC